MKTILLPVEQHDLMGSMLEMARLAAKIFSATVEGVAVRPPFAEIVAVDPMGVTAAPPPDWDEADYVQQARRTFETFWQGCGVPRAAAKGPGPAFRWRDGKPLPETGIGALGRVYDLLVIGRPNAPGVSPRMSLLETALFDSGRPLLIAPPKPPATLGRHILISWNCSSETARATALAMPFLVKAERITVLTVEGGTVPGPAGRDLVRHLEADGVEAVDLVVKPGRMKPGEAVLANAQSLGADLIVKGAYTSSRFRQMIFGGMTSHLLSSAEIPVLMAD